MRRPLREAIELEGGKKTDHAMREPSAHFDETVAGTDPGICSLIKFTRGANEMAFVAQALGAGSDETNSNKSHARSSARRNLNDAPEFRRHAGLEGRGKHGVERAAVDAAIAQRDPPAGIGEMVMMGSGHAFDEAAQAQAAQVAGGLRGCVPFGREAGQGRDVPAQFAVAEAHGQEREQEQDGEHGLDARVRRCRRGRYPGYRPLQRLHSADKQGLEGVGATLRQDLCTKAQSWPPRSPKRQSDGGCRW